MCSALKYNHLLPDAGCRIAGKGYGLRHAGRSAKPRPWCHLMASHLILDESCEHVEQVRMPLLLKALQVLHVAVLVHGQAGRTRRASDGQKKDSNACRIVSVLRNSID